MRLILAALALFATPALADGWTLLTGPEITKALTGKHLAYKQAVQDFRPSGATLYNAGEPSWGSWAVRGDQYCSEWPPTGGWTCYDVARADDGTRIRFMRGGDVSIGRYYTPAN